VVETIRKIRLAAHSERKSIRQISRDLCLSRNKVRKVLRSDKTRFEYDREMVHRPKLGAFVELLSACLRPNKRYQLSSGARPSWPDCGTHIDGLRMSGPPTGKKG